MAESRKERWAKDYVKLTPEDFELPVTPEKRIRVAAAAVTMMRDANMFGGPEAPNAEAVRAILTMSEDEWALDVAELGARIRAYDPVSARQRYDDVAWKKMPPGTQGRLS